MTAQQAAEWFAQNGTTFWQVRRILLDHVQSEGPIPLADGRLVGYVPDGNDWLTEEVHKVMPALIKSAKFTVEGPTSKIEQLISMYTEEFGDANYDVHLTVDKTAANGVLRAGGPAAHKIAPFKVEKNKLGIRG